jgi:hypothetical protein
MPNIAIFTDVADEHKAFIVSVACITIEQLNAIVSFAAIDTALKMSKVLFSVPDVYNLTVTVLAEAVVLANIICLTIVRMLLGTV